MVAGERAAAESAAAEAAAAAGGVVGKASASAGLAEADSLADWASEEGADGAQGASAKAALGSSAEEERVGAAQRMKQK